MQSEHSPSKDWIQLDALAESIGEDPGRWLDGPLDPHPRIRGLLSLQKVRGWRAAERKIARIRNREPRDRIMAVLDERQAYLESIDEDPPQREIREDQEAEWFLNGDPWDQVDRSVAAADASRYQTARVATDGGEDTDGE